MKCCELDERRPVAKTAAGAGMWADMPNCVALQEDGPRNFCFAVFLDSLGPSKRGSLKIYSDSGSAAAPKTWQVAACLSFHAKLPGCVCVFQACQGVERLTPAEVQPLRSPFARNFIKTETLHTMETTPDPAPLWPSEVLRLMHAHQPRPQEQKKVASVGGSAWQMLTWPEVRARRCPHKGQSQRRH